MENLSLSPIEYKKIRVLTTQQLAEAYGVKPIQIQQNYNNHKERFIEGRHYFKLIGDDLKEFLYLDDIEPQNIGINNPSKVRSLYLWTEKGVLRHSKILDTDKAWEVYEMLEDTYFTVREKIFPILTEEQKYQLAIFNAKTREEIIIAYAELDKYRKKQMQLLQPKVDAWERFINTDGTHNFVEVAKMVSTKAKEDGYNFKISGVKLTKLLRNKGILSKAKTKNKFRNLPNKDYEDYFNTTSIEVGKDGEKFEKTQTRVKNNGVEFIYDLLKLQEFSIT